MTKFVLIHFDTWTLPHTQNQNLLWVANMKLSHFAIIMDQFLLVPNICPSSPIFLRNNLTYQICDTALTLWPSHIYKKLELIWISNMNLSQFAIIMNDFLLVPNICPIMCRIFAQQLNLPNL